MSAQGLEPVLVVGAGGMLGRAYSALFARENITGHGVDVPEIDLTEPASVARCLESGVRTVINCAAYTDVDAAEQREELAHAINARGVELLAARCREIGATLVHYSTDYVFDGRAERPYPVDHPRAPLGAYGRSKAAGEELLERSGVRHLLIRTSWLYAPWGKNFVLTIRGLVLSRDVLSVVSDQVGRPTSAEYLAERSLALLRANASGTFHVTDGGQCSWFEFAVEVARLSGAHCRVQPCTTAEFPRPAPRPAYSVLDLSRTEAIVGPSRPWQDNLANVLRSLRSQP